MTIAANAVVFDGTELGAEVVVEDHAVVGKQATLAVPRPRLATRSPLVVGDACPSWPAPSSLPGAGSVTASSWATRRACASESPSEREA